MRVEIILDYVILLLCVHSQSKHIVSLTASVFFYSSGTGPDLNAVTAHNAITVNYTVY